MGLDEHAGDADRDRGAGEHGDEARSPPEAAALPARLLHRMRGVEHHRRAPIAAMIGRPRMSVTRVL